MHFSCLRKLYRTSFDYIISSVYTIHRSHVRYIVVTFPLHSPTRDRPYVLRISKKRVSTETPLVSQLCRAIPYPIRKGVTIPEMNKVNKQPTTSKRSPIHSNYTHTRHNQQLCLREWIPHVSIEGEFTQLEPEGDVWTGLSLRIAILPPDIIEGSYTDATLTKQRYITTFSLFPGNTSCLVQGEELCNAEFRAKGEIHHEIWSQW